MISFSQQNHPEQNLVSENENSTMIKAIAVMALLLGSMTVATVNVLSRALKNVYVSAIIFFHSVFGITVSGICLLIKQDVSLIGYTRNQFLLLGVAVVCGSIAINANTIAY